jgi:hypothetical protein
VTADMLTTVAIGNDAQISRDAWRVKRTLPLNFVFTANNCGSNIVEYFY